MLPMYFNMVDYTIRYSYIRSLHMHIQLNSQPCIIIIMDVYKHTTKFISMSTSYVHTYNLYCGYALERGKQRYGNF